jgi:hypothetical protein
VEAAQSTCYVILNQSDYATFVRIKAVTRDSFRSQLDKNRLKQAEPPPRITATATALPAVSGPSFVEMRFVVKTLEVAGLNLNNLSREMPLVCESQANRYQASSHASGVLCRKDCGGVRKLARRDAPESSVTQTLNSLESRYAVFSWSPIPRNSPMRPAGNTLL